MPNAMLISPMPPEKPRGPSKSAAAAALAAMLVIATPFVATWEGKVNSPHWDRFAKIWDVCHGETKVAMRTYTDAECSAMLDKRLREFGPKVLALSPGIDASPYEWAAHSSFAYNVGIGAYSNSSVRRLYNAGNHAGACKAMALYRFAGGQVVKGLEFRRKGDGKRMGEIELCYLGVL